jgi:hypothetical protein
LGASGLAEGGKRAQEKQKYAETHKERYSRVGQVIDRSVRAWLIRSRVAASEKLAVFKWGYL